MCFVSGIVQVRKRIKYSLCLLSVLDFWDTRYTCQYYISGSRGTHVCTSFVEHAVHKALYLRMMELRAECCQITCYLFPKFKHCYASMSNNSLEIIPNLPDILGSVRNGIITTEGGAYLVNTV
jgi:hypothetical protein